MLTCEGNWRIRFYKKTDIANYYELRSEIYKSLISKIYEYQDRI